MEQNIKSEDARLTNVGKKWTQEEETRLKNLYKQGKSTEEIAEIHQRNYGGIRARLLSLGLIGEEDLSQEELKFV